jgi:hypothetical protein
MRPRRCDPSGGSGGALITPAPRGVVCPQPTLAAECLRLLLSRPFFGPLFSFAVRVCVCPLSWVWCPAVLIFLHMKSYDPAAGALPTHPTSCRCREPRFLHGSKVRGGGDRGPGEHVVPDGVSSHQRIHGRRRPHQVPGRRAGLREPLSCRGRVPHAPVVLLGRRRPLPDPQLRARRRRAD